MSNPLVLSGGHLHLTHGAATPIEEIIQIWVYGSAELQQQRRFIVLQQGKLYTGPRTPSGSYQATSLKF